VALEKNSLLIVFTHKRITIFPLASSGIAGGNIYLFLAMLWLVLEVKIKFLK